MGLVKEYCGAHGLNICLKVIGIGKSTFYRLKDRKDKLSTFKTKYEWLRGKVIKIITDNPSYGYRRIKQELKKQQIIINHKVLKKLLKIWELTIRRNIRRREKSGIEKILEFLGVGANILKTIKARKEVKPLRVIQTDFTRILYAGGKKIIWLCPFMDNLTKIVIGYALGISANTMVALSGYKMAREFLKKERINLQEVVVHEDRGSCFTAYEYVGELTRDGITLSYSDPGKPEDNAEMESFNGRFKDEWKKVFLEAKSEMEVLILVREAIEYYNNRRIHSKLAGMSPLEYLEELKKKNSLL